MSAYRISRLGAHVVVGTEDEAVLICSNLDVARRAVEDAERTNTIPTWELLSQRAAQIAEQAAAVLAAGMAAMLLDGRDENESS